MQSVQIAVGYLHSSSVRWEPGGCSRSVSETSSKSAPLSVSDLRPALLGCLDTACDEASKMGKDKASKATRSLWPSSNVSHNYFPSQEFGSPLRGDGGIKIFHAKSPWKKIPWRKVSGNGPTLNSSDLPGECGTSEPFLLGTPASWPVLPGHWSSSAFPTFTS